MAMDRILDNVYISDMRSVKAYLESKPNKERVAILSVGDFKKPDWEKYPNVIHKHLGGLSDSDTRRFAEILPKAIDFINRARKADKVIVHCIAGRNRSVSVMIGWLMAEKGLTFNHALATLEAKHPDADPWEQLTRILKNLEVKV